MNNPQQINRVMDAVRVLSIVYVSNLIGSVLIAVLVYLSGQLGYSNGLLGAFTIKYCGFNGRCGEGCYGKDFRMLFPDHGICCLRI